MLEANFLWLGLGGLFILIELFTMTFLAFSVALSTLTPLLLLFFFPDLSIEWQGISWVFSLILYSILWGWFFKRDQPLATSDCEIVGQIGIVSQKCSPEVTGILLLQKPVKGFSQWKCIANQPIPANSRVVVTKELDKTLLLVDFETHP